MAASTLTHPDTVLPSLLLKGTFALNKTDDEFWLADKANG